ncbi:HotDog domain-containing protein [Emericellopsis atlantica]|uniref:HotDog domain-containing protein n=1 Tax=Emericellopsis atlantica TaxID=2614577 RepID=A0A9P8CP96_9HYPO|nr:HotDog domain-containing protein [Emericellopsis atlantica]KAG9254308.1 HotDog domain-containing protein [Emericellopsis atlantica]
MSDKPVTKGHDCLIPLLGIVPAHTPKDLYSSNVEHFQSTEATAPLFKQDTIPVILPAFNAPFPHREQFFSKTLRHDEGLTHMLSLFTRQGDNVENPETIVKEMYTLATVERGLSGAPNMLHGGVIMSLVDEAMGALIEINRALGKKGEVFTGLGVTAGLQINFIKPIFVGTTVTAKATMEGSSGRKMNVKCEVTDEAGDVAVRCSSVWVAIKPKF